MTVAALIEMLRKASPTEEVKIFDPDSHQIEPVTGMTYGGHDGIVELHTDDPND